MKISSGSLTRIFVDCLGVKKRGRLVPHNLSEEQNLGRVDWCSHMLRKFDGGRSSSVWDIVTGDATWVDQYDPKTKQRSAVWVFPDENPPVKLNRNKTCFQTNDSVFLCKLRPCCHHTAWGQKDGLQLTGMSTTVCLKSSRHGVNGVPLWVSVVYYSIMTMPARTQQL